MDASKYVSNSENLQKYLSLDQRGKNIAEYVWIDSTNTTRSKCKTVEGIPELMVTLEDGTEKGNLPMWNFDGSSTNQAAGENSDIYLKPVAMYPCPFRRGNNVIVLCETINPDGKPNTYNFRADAATLLNKYNDEGFMWGIEQEYTLLNEYNWPYGWPMGGYPGEQGPYYCGNGTGRAIGRDISEAHYWACLYAGINISGTNAEVMPAQWEFQVGPSKGIAGPDQLWVSRFLLERVAEEFGAKVTFHPKPIKEGKWNGAGLHTNVSTLATMADGGLKVMESYMSKLEKRHKEHMLVYGEGNADRMSGSLETSDPNKFSWGIASRGASVRINRECADKGKGYFEDRRPGSNADPYRICAIMVETICGSAEGVDLVKKVEEAEKK